MNIYVRFRKGKAANTHEVYGTHTVNVDRNSANEIIGFELIGATDIRIDGCRVKKVKRRKTVRPAHTCRACHDTSCEDHGKADRRCCFEG